MRWFSLNEGIFLKEYMDGQAQNSPGLVVHAKWLINKCLFHFIKYLFLKNKSYSALTLALCPLLSQTWECSDAKK